MCWGKVRRMAARSGHGHGSQGAHAGGWREGGCFPRKTAQVLQRRHQLTKEQRPRQRRCHVSMHSAASPFPCCYYLVLPHCRNQRRRKQQQQTKALSPNQRRRVSGGGRAQRLATCRCGVVDTSLSPSVGSVGIVKTETSRTAMRRAARERWMVIFVLEQFALMVLCSG